jgi:uncharacterized membrane protein
VKRVRAVLTIAMAALTVLYPLAVYYGLTRLGTRPVAVLLAVLLGISALLKWKALFQQPRELLGIALAGGALALSALLDDHRFLLATPVLINAGLFLTFAGSLRTDTPLVERFARMQVSDLSAQELRYCRSVTQVWSAFFVVNGATALALALLAPLSWWALYNGLLAYLLIGLLGASEYVIRKRRFGRFGDNPLDRALRAVLAPARNGASR